MSTIDKKAISEALKEAMAREELNTRAVAKALNLNPCYISMCQNPNSWDSMGKTAWVRLEEWAVTRSKISEFGIPEGEEIWKPKEKEFNIKSPGEPTKKISIKTVKDKKGELPVEIRPEILTSSPTVELSYHKEQIDVLNAEICYLKNENEKLKNQMSMSVAVNSVTPFIATQKMALDIEINLIINGQKVRL